VQDGDVLRDVTHIKFTSVNLYVDLLFSEFVQCPFNIFHN